MRTERQGVLARLSVRSSPVGTTMHNTMTRSLPSDVPTNDPAADFRDVVQAAEGDAAAVRRLEGRGEALRLLPRAVQGDRHAFAALRAADPLELDALCATLLTTE